MLTVDATRVAVHSHIRVRGYGLLVRNLYESLGAPCCGNVQAEWRNREGDVTRLNWSRHEWYVLSDTKHHPSRTSQ